jgi:hypothetical protein
MPLNDSDRSWIREEIAKSHETKGMGALARFIRQWSGLGALVAIIIFAFTQWTAYVEFRTKTNEALPRIEKRIDTIESKLTSIEQKLTIQSVKGQSDLDPIQFKNKLPALKTALVEAREQKVSLPDDVVTELREKMASTDNNAPGYWPTASELVSYEYFAPNTDVLPPQLAKAFGPPKGYGQDCFTEPVKDTTPGPRSIPVKIIVWSDCTLYLDDLKGFQQSQVVKMEPQNVPIALFLYRVRIVYNGGEVIPIVEMRTANCKLAFDVQSAPSKQGQMLFASLLATDFLKSSFDIRIDPKYKAPLPTTPPS